ncbi:hypothetical protein LguiA_017614 [Lonicera macranthoides]
MSASQSFIMTSLVMIKDCEALMAIWNVEVVHTLKEANRCTDKLTKLSATQPVQVVRMLIPSTEMIARDS